MLAWLTGWALAGSVLTPGGVPGEVLTIVHDVRESALPDRILAISQALLGRPYVRDPAGEGEGHDPDPLGRYDVFDCLTFVEEVLALALALDPSGAGAVRHALRYGSATTAHHQRRHVMEIQWIPGAVQDGWLVDTTATYGPVERRTRTLTSEHWARWRGLSALGLPAESLPVGPVTLSVLPLTAAVEAVPRLRPGSVLALVRTHREDQPVWITHVGFVLPDGRFRHASPTGSAGVIDTDLATYLVRVGRSSAWPVDGIVVLEAVEQAPMRRISPRP